MTRLHDERGSVALELAILAPALIALGLLVVAAGRVAHARDEVQTVAAQAARAASLQRTLTTAKAAAESEADSGLASEGTTCTTMTVDVTGDFTAPLGTPGSVKVTVTCTTALADLALPGLPGTKALTATGVAPLDAYRGRS